MATSPNVEAHLASGPAAQPFPGCADHCALRSEADHRVANHLAMLSSYIRLKAAEFDHPAGPPSRGAAQLFAQSLDGQVRAIARTHRLLISGQPDGPLSLANLLHEICAPFVSGMDRRIALVEDVATDCFTQAAQIMPISQIVSEAITNAMKHAGSADGFGVISVRCRAGARGGPVVEVCDDGEGLPAGFDPDRDGGFGLNLIRGLSRALGASLAFDDARPGVRVRLNLPRRA